RRQRRQRCQRQFAIGLLVGGTFGASLLCSADCGFWGLSSPQLVEEHGAGKHRELADLEGILGHWKDGLTTAFLEGLNSLFSATKSKARGYRSTEYQIAMLYFVAGKLEIPYYGLLYCFKRGCIHIKSRR